MKKSFLLVLALLVTIPAYMAFVISRSEKSPDKILSQYFYSDISTFSIDPQVSVWLAQSDTNYLYCMGCDTTGIFKSENLNLSKRENQKISFTVMNEYMYYKLGLKEIGSVVSEQNKLYISGYKQEKLWLTLGMYGEILMEDCELDTLFVNINNIGQKELEFVDGCRVKHIALEGKNELNSLNFNCYGDTEIGSLKVNNMNKEWFKVSASAELLAKMSFVMDGKQVTTGEIKANLMKE